MLVFCIVVLLLTLATNVVVLSFRIATRSPSGGGTLSSALPHAHPMDVALLLNLPRRAVASWVVQLLREGLLLADTETGSTAHRLRVAPETARGPHSFFIAELFTDEEEQGSRQEVLDLRPGDWQRRRVLRHVVSSAARAGSRSGLLRFFWIRHALDRTIWLTGAAQGVVLLSALTGAASAHTTLVIVLGIAGLVVTVLTALLRRGVGWLRTAEGEREAQTALALRARLVADPALRARYPERTVLLTQDVPSLPLPDGRTLNAHWVGKLIELLDPGSDPDLSALERPGKA